MDKDELTLRLKCLLRRAGLAGIPTPVLVCMLVLCVGLLAFAVWHFAPGANEDTGDFQAPAQASVQQEGEGTAKQIGIDVEGAVANPGFYLVDDGARVNDAVAAAGGMTTEAARQQVNLAQKLQDGAQVYVPRADEVEGRTGGVADALGSGTASKGKVNLNTATAEELQTLSGIGPSLSQRIIEYRESNGPFRSVDELQNVTGIGATRMKTLKELVCV